MLFTLIHIIISKNTQRPFRLQNFVLYHNMEYLEPKSISTVGVDMKQLSTCHVIIGKLGNMDMNSLVKAGESFIHTPSSVLFYISFAKVEVKLYRYCHQIKHHFSLILLYSMPRRVIVKFCLNSEHHKENFQDNLYKKPEFNKLLPQQCN